MFPTPALESAISPKKPWFILVDDHIELKIWVQGGLFAIGELLLQGPLS